jgi:uncharacterized protein (DUF362 family)
MKPRLTRRQALAGAGAALAAGCQRAPAVLRAPAPVTIVRCAGYTASIYSIVREMLRPLEARVRGKRVVLKPNLVEYSSEAPVNTHPMVVHAALEAMRAMGAAEVRIAEGPGHRRITLEMAEAMGYPATIPGFERLFTDLNLDDIAEVRLRAPRSRLTSLHLPRTALGADLLVSMPKLKTHHWAGATLAMKNLFGTVPGAVYGWPKNVLHWAGIHECVHDLWRVYPRTYALVDGVEAMEGNGPIQGRSKWAGVLIAGDDLASVDATCCRVMGIDPARVGYLALAAETVDLSAARIAMRGEAWQGVRGNFELIAPFAGLRLG